MKLLSQFPVLAFFIAAGLVIGCAEMQNGSTTTTPSTPDTGVGITNTGANRVSQGTQGDTLEACISRIPKDASDSQRMFATLTCERDAKTRGSIDAVPGQ